MRCFDGFAVNTCCRSHLIYTFTQIAFLVDAYRGNVAALPVAHYGIVRHLFPASDRRADPASQGHDPAVRAQETKTPDPHLILCGLISSRSGCSRRPVWPIASQPLVATASARATRRSDQTWISVLAYTFQLYFDFSGYSDMASGSRDVRYLTCRSIQFAVQGNSIIDFWRRWHMSCRSSCAT